MKKYKKMFYIQASCLVTPTETAYPAKCSNAQETFQQLSLWCCWNYSIKGNIAQTKWKRLHNNNTATAPSAIIQPETNALMRRPLADDISTQQIFILGHALKPLIVLGHECFELVDIRSHQCVGLQIHIERCYSSISHERKTVLNTRRPEPSDLG